MKLGSWARGLVARLNGTAVLPTGFAGQLEDDEHPLAAAETEAGPLVATTWGLWLPEQEGQRRVGWHLLSKATWKDGVLGVIEAEQTGTAGEAVLLRDLPQRRFALTKPGRVPDVVHARVTGSIRSSHHRELPGGGAWFVQRKVPGADGIVLQVRPEPGTDESVLNEYAASVAQQIKDMREPGQQ